MTAPLKHTPEDPPGDQQTSSHNQEPTGRARTATDPVPEVQFDALLELLGDEYVCDILRALADGPRTARRLTEQFEMSRPTVYRRLGRLQDAGIISSTMKLDRDGHHRQAFYLVVDEIEFQVHEDGIDGTVPIGSAADD
jgi:DNA-binding transcriptional ArsR family regulator